MDNIEIVQAIGNEICDGCGPDRDCDLGLEDCTRIDVALDILKQRVTEECPACGMWKDSEGVWHPPGEPDCDCPIQVFTVPHKPGCKYFE